MKDPWVAWSKAMMSEFYLERIKVLTDSAVASQQALIECRQAYDELKAKYEQLTKQVK